MNANQNNSLNYIFFLKLEEELPREYFVLAKIFSKVNVTLLPVTKDEFKQLNQGKKKELITFVNNLNAWTNYHQFRKNFIEMSIQNDQITLYEISSFSPFEINYKIQNKKSYHFFQMPLYLNQVAMTIVTEFYKSREVSNEWPGGKRAKLPAMES